jgi:hypothetical protein
MQSSVEENLKKNLDASFERAQRVPKHIFKLDFYSHSIQSKRFKQPNFRKQNGLNESALSNSSFGSNRTSKSVGFSNSHLPRSILKPTENSPNFQYNYNRPRNPYHHQQRHETKHPQNQQRSNGAGNSYRSFQRSPPHRRRK